MKFLIQLKRNAIPQLRKRFRINLKRNLTSANEISQHNANTAFFVILEKKSSNLLKADIYHYYDRNGTKLGSMYKITLLPEKNFESAAQLKRNKF